MRGPLGRWRRALRDAQDFQNHIVKNFPKGYNHINTVVKSRNSEHAFSSLRIWMVHTWLCSFRAAAVASPYPGMLSYAVTSGWWLIPALHTHPNLLL